MPAVDSGKGHTSTKGILRLFDPGDSKEYVILLWQDNEFSIAA